MDSPIVNQLFRQLFRHRPSSKLPHRSNNTRYLRTGTSTSDAYDDPLTVVKQQHRQHAHRPRDDQIHCYQQQREYVTLKTPKSHSKNESNWQQRLDWLPKDKSEEIKLYPTVTSESLRSRRERPTRVKMTTRDFIEDSLYNPNYGYFSKHAVIFNPGEPFDFPSIRSEPEFQRLLDQRYKDFEDALDTANPDPTRQLWHTPTELFQPYYGEAIARYLVTNYKLSWYPYHDLIIYEMGAGNGTLMLNILDYIRDTEPAVYARTKFKIIEISEHLADLQHDQLLSSTYAGGHTDHVEIINRNIFNWNVYVPAPCFFLAMEVFDNFAHDMLRYDPISEKPLLGNVLIDAEGEFYEFYTRHLTRSVSHFLKVRSAATSGSPYIDCKPPFLRRPKFLRRLKQHLPLAPNLTLPEYVPTRLLDLFYILQQYFPLHRLIASDFSSLPGAVRGYNAPVVQTRYRRRVVPVSTPLVEQGYFDILFPTDFNIAELMYRAVTGKLTRVLGHAEFLAGWAYLDETETRNGENPMMSWYRNATILVTV